MKNFLAGCALVISVFPAMAADMPFKSPPPAPFFTWTGCYLGGIWRSTNNVGIGIADGGSGAAVAAAAGSIPIAYDAVEAVGSSAAKPAATTRLRAGYLVSRPTSPTVSTPARPSLPTWRDSSRSPRRCPMT